jgi:hypothetical protein
MPRQLMKGGRIDFSSRPFCFVVVFSEFFGRFDKHNDKDVSYMCRYSKGPFVSIFTI